MSAGAAERGLWMAGRALLGVGAGALTIQNCLFNIDGGEQGVMFNKFGGVSDKMFLEGTHFKVPWFQQETIYSIRTRPQNLPQTTTSTRDMQQVTIWLRLLWKPKPERIPHIHKTLQGAQNLGDLILPSIANEVMKSVLAQYDAEQLLTQRAEVSREMRSQITERCLAYDVEIEDVSIIHLSFSKEFAAAIEAKQVAEQDAEKQMYIVARVEQEKIAAIKRAEGEAEAATKISAALSAHGPGMIEVKRIDAAREIAETLSKANNIMYLPGGGSGGGSQMLLNIGGK